MAINFTKEHFSKMSALALDMLLENGTIASKMGQSLNIIDLLHTTTPNTLNSIRLNLNKEIDAIKNQDEWSLGEASQRKLEKLQNQEKLVNLIIGYKRKMIEVAKAKEEKAELTKQLKELREAQKTPEDKIKELEAKLASIEEPTF